MKPYQTDIPYPKFAGRVCAIMDMLDAQIVSVEEALDCIRMLVKELDAKEALTADELASLKAVR